MKLIPTTNMAPLSFRDKRFKVLVLTILACNLVLSSLGQSKEEIYLQAMKADTVVRQGVFQSTHKNGTIHHVGYNVVKPLRELGFAWTQVPVGTWMRYYSNSNIRDSVLYNDLGIQVEVYFYDRKGRPKFAQFSTEPTSFKLITKRGRVKIKVLDFVWHRYHPKTGAMLYKSNYVGDKPHGAQEKYDKHGNLKHIKYFEHGKRVKREEDVG